MGSPIVKHRATASGSISRLPRLGFLGGDAFRGRGADRGDQGSHWEKTRERMAMLEGLFESTPLFRKPISGR